MAKLFKSVLRRTQSITTGTSNKQKTEEKQRQRVVSRACSIDDFEVEREVGRGSFGSAYAATNNLTDRQVCIKVTRTTESVEVDAMQMLAGHCNIVSLYSTFSLDDETRLIEMELINGVDLFEFLSSRSALLTESEARPVARQMCSAVSYCHTVGIAHRDIKPENWMVAVQPDASIKVTLIDFGLAVLEDATMRMDTAGSLDFSAPETLQRRGTSSYSPYDATLADAWSLGVVLYQLPTWRYPFIRKARVSAARKNKPQPTIPFSSTSTLSEDFREMVTGLMDADPDTRLSVAAAMAHAWFQQ
jgi:serine/threonine protein kinase